MFVDLHILQNRGRGSTLEQIWPAVASFCKLNATRAKNCNWNEKSSVFKVLSSASLSHLTVEDCFELRCFCPASICILLDCQRASPGGHRPSGPLHRHTIVDELKSSSHAAYQIPSTTYLRMLHLLVILANP